MPERIEEQETGDCFASLSQAQLDSLASRLRTQFDSLYKEVLRPPGQKPEPEDGRLCGSCLVAVLTDLVACSGHFLHVDPGDILLGTVRGLKKHYGVESLTPYLAGEDDMSEGHVH